MRYICIYDLFFFIIFFRIKVVEFMLVNGYFWIWMISNIIVMIIILGIYIGLDGVCDNCFFF